MTPKINIYETATTVSLRYNAPDELQTPTALAERALTTLFAGTRAWYRALQLDVRLTAYDPEYGVSLSEPQPTQPFFYLHQEPLPPGINVNPLWVGSVPQAVAQVTLAGALAWLAERLTRANAEVTAPITWQELRIDVAVVQVPAGIIDPTAPTLAVIERIYPFQHPVVWQDGQAWVGGPIRQTLTAPVAMRLSNELGVLELAIDLYWSLWNAVHGAGWPMIQTLLDDLLAQGWELTYHGALKA